MLENISSKSDSTPDCVLSPKQTEERRVRSQVLSKIDQQIDKILSMSHENRAHYTTYLQQIVSVEQHYKTENQQLKQSLATMTEKYTSLESMYLSLKEELEVCYSRREEVEEGNAVLKSQIGKLKVMVKNQEDLIDEYRRGIEEEVSLEKQFMKAEFQEQKARLEKDFNRALRQIQKQYSDKLHKLTKVSQVKDYQLQCRELKKILGLARQSSSKETLLPGKPLQSEYSTNDQDNPHHQPVFMI